MSACNIRAISIAFDTFGSLSPETYLLMVTSVQNVNSASSLWLIPLRSRYSEILFFILSPFQYHPIIKICTMMIHIRLTTDIPTHTPFTKSRVTILSPFPG